MPAVVPYAHRGFDRKAEVGVLIIEFNSPTTKTYSLLAEACCNGSTQSRRGDDLLVRLAMMAALSNASSSSASVLIDEPGSLASSERQARSYKSKPGRNTGAQLLSEVFCRTSPSLPRRRWLECVGV